MTATTTFGNVSDSPTNYLGGDHAELKEKIMIERLQKLKEMRNDYWEKQRAIRNKIQSIKENKRIKNKNISFEDLADMEKSWFNYRSLDFFLYRIGYVARCTDTTKDSVQEELYKLYREVTNKLMLLGQYKGHNSIYWYWAGGCEKWREAGSTEDYEVRDRDFIKEELGILLY